MRCDGGFLLSEWFSVFMAPIPKVLEFLRIRIIRFAWDCIKRFSGRRVTLLAFLGRKLIVWWHFWFGRYGRPKSAERPSLETKASSYSVSGGSAVVREHVIAASYVPASAIYPSLHKRTEEQPETVAQIVGDLPPDLASTSVDNSHDHGSSHPFGGKSFVNRSSGAISIQSRASERLSIISNSRHSLRAPHGQPSRLHRATRRSSVNSTGNLSVASIQSRASVSDVFSRSTNSRESIASPLGRESLQRRGTHRQFGRGPDLSRSRERATSPPTPMTRPRTPIQLPRLEIITTKVHFPPHGDGNVNPVVQSPEFSSYTHEPLRASSTSMVVDIQSPSSDSLPASSLTGPPPITDGLFSTDSDIHLSPGSPAVDLYDESYPGLPTSSSDSTLDYFIPEGRFVQLIHSEQIPRYEKNVTMQVVPYHPIIPP